MKKNGFTISELIVALGITAVIAAVTAPLLNGLIPDNNKMKVLKANKILTEITGEIISDPSIYFINEGVCIGLGCTDSPFNPLYSAHSGADKFFNILASKLGAVSVDSTNKKFTTADGIEWRVSASALPASGVKTQDFRIFINTGSGDSCAYSGDSCSEPGIFEFTIDTYGKVAPSDSLSKAYLRNPHKMNDRRADFASAKEIEGCGVSST